MYTNYAAGTSAIKYPAGVAAPNVNVGLQSSGLDRRTSPTQAWSSSAYRVSACSFVGGHLSAGKFVTTMSRFGFVRGKITMF